MCDVQGCKKHSIKKITGTANTSTGTITKKVNLCSEHIIGLEKGNGTMYSMGCHVEYTKIKSIIQ